LGLRLEGEQVEAGMRFVGIARKDTYDIVVGNPPYQGTSKLAQAAWFKKHYPRGKADLYSCFLERGLELAKAGGLSALLTMRGWMFLNQFQELREHLLEANDLTLIGDIDRGGFSDIPDEVVSTTMAVFARSTPDDGHAIALLPTPLDDRSRDADRTARKLAALLTQVGRHEFDVAKLSGIEGRPLVYWWSSRALSEYIAAPKLGEIAPVRQGLITGDNTRFVRCPWETASDQWKPFIKGSEGRTWCEPLESRVNWETSGLEIKTLTSRGRQASRPQNEAYYFRLGVAVTMLGAEFGARAHRVPSIFQDKGSSAFVEDIADAVCYMNRSTCRRILESLNPTISFTVSDITRLPIFPVLGAHEIFRVLLDDFGCHESHREPSVEFKSPGPSPWRYAQAWAQRAVDRPQGEPLPPYDAELDPPDPIAYVSHAIGVALGRFSASGEGIINDSPDDALPAGILYLSGDESLPDSLKHPTAQRILDAWKEHAPAILSGKRLSLIEWLKKDFFRYHLSLYENRPIYFPLASTQKSFVAFISIHRWTDSTLQDLLALHLTPALRQLSGEIADLNHDRASSDPETASVAEKQFTRTKRLHDELTEFIATVTECAERGAPPTDSSCPPRADDAKFQMDLDDGVMINSAALWPLLEPMWPKPKVWWKELCQAKGRKDYDWSHLARRYFPARVEEKCKLDPSLGVAHGCFWKYHPAKAYAWELRLQHEIKPDFTIDEPESDACRARFLAEHADEAAAIREKEDVRRERAEKKKLKGEEDAESDADNADDAEAGAEDDDT
jgi:hypothetical protein